VEIVSKNRWLRDFDGRHGLGRAEDTRPRQWASPVLWRRLAGAEGFEPSRAGIKIRCLTAWLRPIRFKAADHRASPAAFQRARKANLANGKIRVAGGGRHGYKGALRGLRRVAQPGRAPRSGRGGRRFESSLSDQYIQFPYFFQRDRVLGVKLPPNVPPNRSARAAAETAVPLGTQNSPCTFMPLLRPTACPTSRAF
jgi:hypothetical protein